MKDTHIFKCYYNLLFWQVSNKSQPKVKYKHTILNNNTIKHFNVLPCFYLKLSSENNAYFLRLFFGSAPLLSGKPSCVRGVVQPLQGHLGSSSVSHCGLQDRLPAHLWYTHTQEGRKLCVKWILKFDLSKVCMICKSVDTQEKVGLLKSVCTNPYTFSTWTHRGTYGSTGG